MLKRQRPGLPQIDYAPSRHPSQPTLHLPTTTATASGRRDSGWFPAALNQILSLPCIRRGRIRIGRQKILNILLACIVVLACLRWMTDQPPQCAQHDNHSSSTPQDICFVTCIFGNSVEEVDQPANVEWFAKHWCHTQFLLVTNLPTLPAPGWNKIVKQTAKPDSNNFIVQSREAKFLGWRALPNVQKECAAVIYMDGYLQPKRNWWLQRPTTYQKFQAIVRQVQKHSWGLSQVKQAYFNGLTMETILRNLVRDRKDTVEHVNVTLSWLQRQEDYQPVLTYYLNKYFAYDPNNVKYQELSSWFWRQYTTYGGLWRDQPLWAFTLHHFNCTPGVMTSKGTITKGGDLFETGGTLGWGKHVYV